MATKISTLKENGDTVYPVTKVECVYNDSNQNVSDLLNAKADKDLSNIGTALAPVRLYTGSAGGAGTYSLTDTIRNFSKLMFVCYYTSGQTYYITGTIPVSLFETMTGNNSYLVSAGSNWVAIKYNGNALQIQVYAVSNCQFYTVYGIK